MGLPGNVPLTLLDTMVLSPWVSMPNGSLVNEYLVEAPFTLVLIASKVDTAARF